MLRVHLACEEAADDVGNFVQMRFERECPASFAATASDLRVLSFAKTIASSSIDIIHSARDAPGSLKPRSLSLS